MGFYIRYTYTTGGGGVDHVGPFSSTDELMRHKEQYGPVDGEVVCLSEIPSPLMTPADHMAYVSKRY